MVHGAAINPRLVDRSGPRRLRRALAAAMPSQAVGLVTVSAVIFDLPCRWPDQRGERIAAGITAATIRRGPSSRRVSAAPIGGGARLQILAIGPVGVETRTRAVIPLAR